MSGPLPREAGQASVELVATVPAVLLVGVFLFQLLAVGYAAVLAGNAAEAGAVALAAGRDAAAAARDALPGWSRQGASARVRGGRVEVSVRPLGPLARLAPDLRLRARAAVGEEG
ncbi:MAG: pilus assembly protein [Thermoleophilaceae bacterium]|nr:pilus assembly protein [Thermoleophilaceae bacterium]